jgi:hypothetical protein
MHIYCPGHPGDWVDSTEAYVHRKRYRCTYAKQVCTRTPQSRHVIRTQPIRASLNKCHPLSLCSTIYPATSRHRLHASHAHCFNRLLDPTTAYTLNDLTDTGCLTINPIIRKQGGDKPYYANPPTAADRSLPGPLIPIIFTNC